MASLSPTNQSFNDSFNTCLWDSSRFVGLIRRVNRQSTGKRHTLRTRCSKAFDKTAPKKLLQYSTKEVAVVNTLVDVKSCDGNLGVKHAVSGLLHMVAEHIDGACVEGVQLD